MRLVVRPRPNELRYTYRRLLANSGFAQYLAMDRAGNIYYYTNNRINRLDPSGRMTTVAGTGMSGNSPDGTPAAQAALDISFGGLTADPQGNLYFSEGQANRVRTIRNGVLQTVIGPNNTFGGGDFPLRFLGPRGLHFDPLGRLLVTWFWGVLRVLPDGRMEFPWARGPGSPDFKDVATSADGSVLYLLESSGNRVYRYAQGQLQPVAGTGTSGYNGDGLAAVSATLALASGIDVDRAGNLYIADRNNSRVRVVTPEGTIFTIAGNGRTAGANRDGMPATDAVIQPLDVFVDANGDLITCDFSNIIKLERDRTPAPQISAGGLKNLALGADGLAPGTLFSLRGANFASAAAEAATTPWPGELGGAQVLINGRAAPLSAVGPTEIRGQIPWETTVSDAAIAVRTAGGTTPELRVPIVAAAPGILSVTATGDNPAPVGAEISVFFTGQGAVDNVPPSGAAAPDDPLARPLLPVRVTVGDTEVEAVVVLARGMVGIAQAVFLAPDVPPGDYPVVITVGEASSGPATISITAAAP